ncbi:MAG: TROVE domain-containing protein [Acidobacteria bacterium]|nr:TROVE domain-containing protein [Acidobacteriota bacterium]
MANKNLFQSFIGKLLPATNALNHEGAPAFALEPKHQLAQYAATGCFGRTFYSTAGDQLDKVLALATELDVKYVGQCAIWARRRGLMKDMPALLCAVLSTRDLETLERVFPLVIDNGKMLRNFVQIVRSGVTGRKSLGSAPKRMVREWLAARSVEAIFRDSVGQSPSMADVVKMVHPKPADPARTALYGYLIGRAVDEAQLPEVVRAHERFKKGESREVPDVPMQMLVSLDLDDEAWKEIARNASWTQMRMNLNTFARHGVFDDRALTNLLATRLRNPEAIRRARAFPYQLLMAFLAADGDVPSNIREALQDAMEIAIGNVPAIGSQVFVCPDVSGSMASAVTGGRKGSTSEVRCIDVAALVAAAVLRKNPGAEVLPFEDKVVAIDLNPRDSVMTNAKKLAAIGGGGTSCSAPLRELNRRRATGDLVLFVSDNESWVDARKAPSTAVMREWEVFRSRNPKARLVCIDIQPHGTTQAVERDEILNVGGFSDAVFDLVAEHAASGSAPNRWVREIEAIAI